MDDYIVIVRIIVPGERFLTLGGHHVPLLVLGQTLLTLESTTEGTSGASFLARRPSQKSEGKDKNRATTCCKELEEVYFLKQS